MPAALVRRVGADAAAAGARGAEHGAARRQPAPTFFGAYGEWMQTPPATWDDIAWLRKQWDGPFMLKGIIRVDDARRAVDAGVSAISVSNHGGNNLDGTPASIRALPAIAEAVGDEVEVLLDGGIRRGSDVVKALALGARAVMIGRAYLWGLGAERPGGRRERARHASQRHRLRADGARQGERARPGARRTSSSPTVSSGGSALPPSSPVLARSPPGRRRPPRRESRATSWWAKPRGSSAKAAAMSADRSAAGSASHCSYAATLVARAT